MDTEDAVAVTAVVVAVLIVMSLAFFLGGFVLYLGWNWGAVPAFGVPAIGYVPACFVSLLLNAVFGRLKFTVDKKEG